MSDPAKPNAPAARWQQGCETVAERDAYILEHRLFTDATFLVGAEEKAFRCHKLQLAKTSPVMADMFYGGTRSQDVVRVPGTSPGAFEALLNYMYLGLVRLEDFEEACGLLYLAKKYELPAGMVRRCRGFLWRQIRPSNVWTALQFAAANLETQMYETAQQVVRRFTTKCLRAPGLLGAPLSELLRVVTCPQLSLDSELELYDGCVRWAKDGVERGAEPAQTTVVQGDPTSASEQSADAAPEEAAAKDFATAGSDSEEYSNAVDLETPVPEVLDSPGPERSTLGAPDGGDCGEEGGEEDGGASARRTLREVMAPLLPHIRFLAMTQREFVDGPGGCEVLTDREARLILLKFGQSKTVNLPDNISTNTTKRTGDLVNDFFVYGTDHVRGEDTSGDILWNVNSSFVNGCYPFSYHWALLGVRIPTQLRDNTSDEGSYQEDLTVLVFNGKRGPPYTLHSSTNFSAQVAYNSEVDVPFRDTVDDPEGCWLDIKIVFHVTGKYPLYPVPRLEDYVNVESSFNNREAQLVSKPDYKYIRSVAFISK